jgi:hypothetical protein
MGLGPALALHFLFHALKHDGQPVQLVLQGVAPLALLREPLCPDGVPFATRALRHLLAQLQDEVLELLNLFRVLFLVPLQRLLGHAKLLLQRCDPLIALLERCSQRLHVLVPCPG